MTEYDTYCPDFKIGKCNKDLNCKYLKHIVCKENYTCRNLDCELTVVHKKENEIKDLNENHHQLKNEIEKNQKNYEKLIDEAADEISNFVEKANLENLS